VVESIIAAYGVVFLVVGAFIFGTGGLLDHPAVRAGSARRRCCDNLLPRSRAILSSWINASCGSGRRDRDKVDLRSPSPLSRQRRLRRQALHVHLGMPGGV